jgi:hypothetical protein
MWTYRYECHILSSLSVTSANDAYILTFVNVSRASWGQGGFVDVKLWYIFAQILKIFQGEKKSIYLDMVEYKLEN